MGTSGLRGDRSKKVDIKVHSNDVQSLLIFPGQFVVRISTIEFGVTVVTIARRAFV